MQKISPERRAQLDKEASVIALYKSGEFTTEQVAKNYDLTPRSVQRIAKKYGVVRTQAEANNLDRFGS
jgi:DNA-directed RNA polymerase specialized sigma subunit